MSRWRTAAVYLAAAMTISAAGGARAAIVPDNGVLDFSVVRSGTEIGSHRLSFRRDGDRIDVSVVTRIAVKMAFVTVYRFEHDAHEAWQNGKLVAMETKTHDDGKDHVLKVVRGSDGRYNVDADGKRFTADGDAVPASLWNPEFVRTTKLMNSLVGTPLKIAISYKGEEPIFVHGASVRAKHFSMTGDLARELWYDQNWVLVHMELDGKDGSHISYNLR